MLQGVNSPIQARAACLNITRGTHIIEDPNAVAETWKLTVHMPRSKKKRIQKKCRRERWDLVREPAIFQIGYTFLVHPDLMTKFREEFGARV